MTSQFFVDLSLLVFYTLIVVYYTIDGRFFMRVKIKSFLIKAKNKITNALSLWIGCIAAQKTFYAAETDLGKGIETASGKVLNEISSVYCGSIFYLLLGINVIVLAFSKNDKVLGIAKRTLIFIVLAYFVLKMIAGTGGGKVGSTLTTMEGWL